MFLVYYNDYNFRQIMSFKIDLHREKTTSIYMNLKVFIKFSRFSGLS